MNNPYLAHFGAQIATARFGAIPRGIAAIVVELDGWLTFVQEGGRTPGRSAVREGLMAENNEHNSFHHFPTTENPGYDIGPDPLDPAQRTALRALFTEAARVATLIEDYNTEQNKVASFKAGPGATPTHHQDASFTVPGFAKEKFPCGYYVSLDYESMIPRYKSSRYQQRFLMVLLGLLSNAVEAKHGYYRPPGGAWDDPGPTSSPPSYVRFLAYGNHLTKTEHPGHLSLDPGVNVRSRGIHFNWSNLAGMYSRMDSPRTGEEDNHDESDGATGSVYRALISFVRHRIFPWVNCKAPIRLNTGSGRDQGANGFPWVLNQHYFGTGKEATFVIIDQVPEDKRGERCSAVADLPIPVIELTRLPTEEQRAALAAAIPSAAVDRINWRNTMCRPFGSIPTSSPTQVEMGPTERSDAPLTTSEEALVEEERTARRDVERRIEPAPAAASSAPTPYTPEPAPSAAPSAAPPPPPRGGFLATRRRQEEEATQQIRRTPGDRIEEMSMKQLMVATALVGAGATLVGVMLTRSGQND